MPRTPVVYSHVFTPFSQFSNGLHGRLNVLPLRRLNAAFDRRIFFRHRLFEPNHHSFFCSSLNAACLFLLLITYHSLLIPTYGQSATATLSGIVIDQNNAVVPKVSIAVINIAQGFERSTTTNDEGAFVVPLLPPGNYIVKAEREGFTPVEVRDVVLNVNDHSHLKISLKVAGVDQTVDIVDIPSLINELPAVATVVDRQFVANLPLNGRSFQSLIALTPGYVVTKTSGDERGQFSVNGQRANANYFMVDGVSANIGVVPSFNPGQSAGGSLPGLSAFGGTNNLASIEALEEFKVLTSTYAPEFGRTPGAQVSIATRAGTNRFTGVLFNYFRNDALDANDWFNNARGLPKPATRQNDFGGVLGGPIIKNRTFFFFSFEGLRLRLPQSALTDVPSLQARQAAPAQIQPFLNAFPRPTGPAKPNGFANFASSFSNPSSLNATSIRVDHSLNEKVSLFARYNYSPSETVQRGVSRSLNTVNPVQSKTQTLTGSAGWLITPQMNNDFRINWSRNEGTSFYFLDDFGGAVVPADSVLFPPFASSTDSQFGFLLIGGRNANLSTGAIASNLQRQINLIDNFSVYAGSHQLKFGIDYRRLSPIFGPRVYSQLLQFRGIAGALAATAGRVTIQSQVGPLIPIFTNLSLYGQNTQKISRRLTLTYGLRWEYNPPPFEKNGNAPFTVLGLDDPSTASLAPRGTPLWETRHNNFAPRFGVAFQLSQRPKFDSVLRGGIGIFYDLGNGQAANAFGSTFPFTSSKTLLNVRFPLTAAQVEPAPFRLDPPVSFLIVFDPKLELPRTYQWNASLEQSLGATQALTVSYVAAIGRRLLRQESFENPNPTFIQLLITRNSATSDYHALQLQFERRMSRGLQALASYTWSHSIDIASNDSSLDPPDQKIDPRQDRGPSDFDVRHAFIGAMTYDIPSLAKGRFGRSILTGWSIDTFFTARSATPVNVTYSTFASFGFFELRPDLIQGVPLYLNDATAGGGRVINPAAFSIPSTERQGSLGRNSLRGFPVSQLDFALRRQFKLNERFNLQLKAEFFNIFNHPNFADPDGSLGFAFGGFFFPFDTFGRSASMLGRSLGSGGLEGGFNPLYQVGGPRSVQLAFKLQF